MTDFTLRNDVVFKFVFGTEGNKRLLVALLNAVLESTATSRIVEITLLNPVNLGDHVGSKATVLDVKAKDQAGRHYNVEIQIYPDRHFIHRVIYYNDKLYAGQLATGDSYDRLNKTITISILDFTLLQDESELHNIYRYRNLRSGRELTDIKELHFIELPKYRPDALRKSRTKLEKWLDILKFGEHYLASSEPLPEALLAEEEIVMALDAMKQVTASDTFREMLLSREKAIRDEASRIISARQDGIEQGLQQGVQQGLQQGKRQAILEIARGLLLSGVDALTIQKSTGLSIAEIEALRSS